MQVSSVGEGGGDIHPCVAAGTIGILEHIAGVTGPVVILLLLSPENERKHSPGPAVQSPL